MADAEEWTTNASDAFTISLMKPHPNGLQLMDKFHPRYTYSIFGEDEMIYGYKNLQIQLLYRANDMRPNLRITYTKKLNAIGKVEIPDVSEVLKEEGHLPKIAFVSPADFEESSTDCTADWTPPGTLHKTIEAGTERYEIWKGQLSVPAIKQIVHRVQILVPLFIEGGSYIIRDDNTTEDDDRWTVFLMFRKESSGAYTFVGYSTVHRFYPIRMADIGYTKQTLDPDADISQNFDLTTRPTRSRLSQFLILPPFQNKGNGRRLYDTIFEYYYKHHPQTIEFAIEDPNEEFDDLRDLADLSFLRKEPSFQALTLNTKAEVEKGANLPDLVTGPESVDVVRQRFKMTRRQFNRILEIDLMARLPDAVRPAIDQDPNPNATPDQKNQLRLWQLLVKSRLMRQHKDTLSQFELDFRRQKLDETLINVELEFARVLSIHAKWSRHDAPIPETGAKRKLSRDSSEDEDEGVAKKARVGEDGDQAMQG